MTQVICPYVDFRVRLEDDSPFAARYRVEGLKKSFWWPEHWVVLGSYCIYEDEAFQKAEELCQRLKKNHGR